MKLLNKSPVYVRVQGKGLIAPGDKQDVAETGSIILTCELGKGYSEISHNDNGEIALLSRESGLELSLGPERTVIIR